MSRFKGTGRSIGGRVQYPSKGKKRWWETARDWYNTGSDLYNKAVSYEQAARNKFEELDPYAEELFGATGVSKPYHSIKDWAFGKKSWKDMSREVGTWEPDPGTPLDWWIRFTGQKKERQRQGQDVTMTDAKPIKFPESGPGPVVVKRTRSGGEYGPGPSFNKSKARKKIERGPGPGTIIAKERMKRKYFTTGSYGGKFSGRLKKRVPSASLSGCVLKGERNSTVSDSTAVYIGHTALPLIPMLRAIGWSLVRLVAKKWGQDFTSFLGAINGPDKTSAVSLRVTLTIRSTIGGICDDHTWTDTSSTWAELGDNIMHHIISNCPATCQYYEIVRIKFANIDATAVESLQTLVFHGSHLKFTVSGFSKLRVQNMTVSTSGDAATNENKDDIANNPLVGKQYFGKGHYHQLKFNNDYTTSIPAIYYAADQGYLTFSPSTATSLETAMFNYLSKPPAHKAFTNMKAYRSIKLMPGEIKYSVVKCKYTFNLNNWCRILLPTLSNTTALGSVGSSGTGQFCHLSKNSILAFEHMLHSGTEPDISLGYQLDFTVTGICSYKKKQYCVPDVGSAVLSKIVEEEPEVS